MPYFLGSRNNLYADLLREVVKNRVRNRLWRIKPRAVKRRRKPFPLLHKQRNLVKNKLLRKYERALKQAA